MDSITTVLGLGIFDILRGHGIVFGLFEFGSCSNPSIKSGPAFNDGRPLREFPFRPVDQIQYAQDEALKGNIDTNDVCNTYESALNRHIVTRAVRDTLVDKCDANVVTINDYAAIRQATAGLSGQTFADAFDAAGTKDL